MDPASKFLRWVVGEIGVRIESTEHWRRGQSVKDHRRGHGEVACTECTHSVFSLHVRLLACNPRERERERGGVALFFFLLFKLSSESNPSSLLTLQCFELVRSAGTEPFAFSSNLSSSLWMGKLVSRNCPSSGANHLANVGDHCSCSWLFRKGRCAHPASMEKTKGRLCMRCTETIEIHETD